MEIEKIVQFVKESGYEGVEYDCKWKDYNVYVIIYSYTEISYVGIPMYVLVKDNKIRMATAEENKKIFNEKLSIK